jgi:trehalose/maltose transport system substrate-binding protein
MRHVLIVFAVLACMPLPARAVTLTMACGAVGIEYELCREGAQSWAAQAGHEVRFVQSPNLSNDRLALFQQMLAGQSADVDVFQIDVIWPGTLGAHLLDLNPALDAAERAAHFPALLAAFTVPRDGRRELKALPWFADVGLLYYRRDLLEKHGLPPPRTWAELQAAAERVLAAEPPGDRPLAGFVFQGRAYEGLTCNALEWVASHGGGTFIEPSGRISLNRPAVHRALRRVAGWMGGIVPRGVLTYGEEDARGVFQSGHALFMRNWPYAWALLNAPDSALRGKVGVVPLPRGGGDGTSVGTLGGSGLAVSRYSAHPRLAVDLVRHLTSEAEQARRAIRGAFNPTRPALYANPRVLAAQPFLADLRAAVEGAVARPSAIAGERYNRASATIWNAVHDVLAGKATAERAMAQAERRLRRLSRDGEWR